MALNLFSKQYQQAQDSRFIVCDVIPDATRSFCSEFTTQYPDAQIGIAATPKEWVFQRSPTGPPIDCPLVYSQSDFGV